MNTLILKDVEAKTQAESDRFYTPLMNFRGAYEYVDAAGDKIVEARAALIGDRKYGSVHKAEEGKDPLLIIHTTATLDRIVNDWQKNFGMALNEEQLEEWILKHQ